jgi:hypothetical protein
MDGWLYYGGILVAVVVVAICYILIVMGWVFAIRGTIQSTEGRALSFCFAILGTFVPPMNIVPIVLNVKK